MIAITKILIITQSTWLKVNLCGLLIGCLL